MCVYLSYCKALLKTLVILVKLYIVHNKLILTNTTIIKNDAIYDVLAIQMLTNL